ncbi:MAG: hypothetical protein Ct9H90mP14_2530 [Methanobacteriota archaeon]|nr:MAG: hypothetical protein Ct9H90mP14_2530 [Euryarchaeota archaeon]
MSAVEVKTADTYKDDGHAFKQGLMDPKMGVIDPGIRCETCGNKQTSAQVISATSRLNYLLCTSDSPLLSRRL